MHFDPNLETGKKRILANILAKNHPLIEVLRLIPGNDVINISFSGIKKLNDTYGQGFVDALLLSGKNKILESMEKTSQTWGKSGEHVRLVRDDYKNLTLSAPPGSDTISLLFQGSSDKKVFLKNVLENMSGDIESLAREKGINPEIIRKDILDHF